MVTQSASKFLIVPCFNEANRIAPVEYWKELEDSSVFLVFVDDASTDSTVARIKSMNLISNITIVKKENSGKANAIREGFLSIDRTRTTVSAENIIGFLDADSAFSVKDIKRMFDLAELGKFEAIFASRVKLAGRSINRSRVRHLLGRGIMAFLSSSGFDLPYDSQAGLKVFKSTPELMACFREPFETRWFLELEVLLRFKKNCGRNLIIWEEPLHSWEETKGSKLFTLSSFFILFQVIHLFLKFIKQARR